ncbi:hypothetical protein [Micromonospora zamorensis]|uniref:hypothetical protein n=1 Tax=Micromonospora zamorensis TaxID=709883 RepID=UPI00339DB998
MISKLSAATVRHRHVVLVLGLLVASVNVATLGFGPTLGPRLFPPLLILALAALVLAIIVLGVRPTNFVVRPEIPAFVAPVPAWVVFLAIACLGPTSGSIGAVVRATRQGDVWPFDVVFAIAWFLLAALMTVGAWRGHGVRLHPRDVRQTWTLGSLAAPWEALRALQIPPAAAAAGPSWLRMRLAEPHLVRRRGVPWSLGVLRTDNVDAGFLDAVIEHYVDHPEHRAAIGSQAEHERLLAELPQRNG